MNPILPASRMAVATVHCNSEASATRGPGLRSAFPVLKKNTVLNCKETQCSAAQKSERWATCAINNNRVW